MEQKQYINNCIFKITEEEENWIDEDPQRTTEQENWVNNDPQRMEEQNVKVEKFLKKLNKKKVTFSLKNYNKIMCLYHQYQKNFKHYLCLLSFYIYFRI